MHTNRRNASKTYKTHVPINVHHVCLHNINIDARRTRCVFRPMTTLSKITPFFRPSWITDVRLSAPASTLGHPNRRLAHGLEQRGASAGLNPDGRPLSARNPAELNPDGLPNIAPSCAPPQQVA